DVLYGILAARVRHEQGVELVRRHQQRVNVLRRRVADVGPGEGGLDQRSGQAADVDNGRIRSSRGVIVDDDGGGVRVGGNPTAQGVGEQHGADVRANVIHNV